jgi:hypothetical protein
MSREALKEAQVRLWEHRDSMAGQYFRAVLRGRLDDMVAGLLHSPPNGEALLALQREAQVYDDLLGLFEQEPSILKYHRLKGESPDAS